MNVTINQNVKGKVIGFSILILLLSGNMVYAQLTGNLWQSLDQPHKALYLKGFEDGMMAGQVTQELKPQIIPKLFKCLGNWNGYQKIAIVDKYMKENPHEWGQDMSEITFSAIINAVKKSK